MGKVMECGDIAKIIAVSDICEVYVGAYFISEGHITQPTAVVCHVVAERNASLLVSDEPYNKHCVTGCRLKKGRN
jgi:hypothetical protein